MQRGYHSVSMREISEQLEFSKAALYHHFRDKQALLLEILLVGIDQAGRIVAAAAQESGASARITTLLTGIARHRHQQLQAMRLAERDAVHLPDAERATMLAAYRTKFVGPIEGLLRDGQAAGEISPDLDPAWLTRALLALAQPLLSGSATGSDSAVASTVSLFMNGAAKVPFTLHEPLLHGPG